LAISGTPWGWTVLPYVAERKSIHIWKLFCLVHNIGKTAGSLGFANSQDELELTILKMTESK